MTSVFQVDPLPPSANELWDIVMKFGRGGKKYPSKKRSEKYESWLQEMVLRMRMGLPVFTRFPVALRMVVRGGSGFPTSRDLDNCWKATIDALKIAGRIPDDNVKFVDETSQKYHPAATPDAVAACFLEVAQPEECPT